MPVNYSNKTKDKRHDQHKKRKKEEHLMLYLQPVLVNKHTGKKAEHCCQNHVHIYAVVAVPIERFKTVNILTEEERRKKAAEEKKASIPKGAFVSKNTSADSGQYDRPDWEKRAERYF